MIKVNWRQLLGIFIGFGGMYLFHHQYSHIWAVILAGLMLSACCSLNYFAGKVQEREGMD